jgi:hypothetical protein
MMPTSDFPGEASPGQFGPMIRMPGVVPTTLYAMSRAAITRRDSGKDGFNFSGILGMEMGIALSNAYYPPKSVNGEEVAERTFTSFTATALGNLLPEFWPDIREKWNHFKHKQP